MGTAARRVVREMPCINILQVTETKEELEPVAAYARVSTEKEEQEDSFERQVEHYTQMISENPKWRMVEVYADPGISGTRAEKRPNFMRMIQDCREGKIKKILVKSISRFARNTVDAYNSSRKDGGTMETTNNAAWETLPPEEKHRALYDRQVATLKTFLEHGAISKEQHDKSLYDLTVKMGYGENSRTCGGDRNEE